MLLVIFRRERLQPGRERRGKLSFDFGWEKVQVHLSPDRIIVQHYNDMQYNVETLT